MDNTNESSRSPENCSENWVDVNKEPPEHKESDYYRSESESNESSLLKSRSHLITQEGASQHTPQKPDDAQKKSCMTVTSKIPAKDHFESYCTTAVHNPSVEIVDEGLTKSSKAPTKESGKLNVFLEDAGQVGSDSKKKPEFGQEFVSQFLMELREMNRVVYDLKEKLGYYERGEDDLKEKITRYEKANNAFKEEIARYKTAENDWEEKFDCSQRATNAWKTQFEEKNMALTDASEQLRTIKESPSKAFKIALKSFLSPHTNSGTETHTSHSEQSEAFFGNFLIESENEALEESEDQQRYRPELVANTVLFGTVTDEGTCNCSKEVYVMTKQQFDLLIDTLMHDRSSMKKNFSALRAAIKPKKQNWLKYVITIAEMISSVLHLGAVVLVFLNREKSKGNLFVQGLASTEFQSLYMMSFGHEILFSPTVVFEDFIVSNHDRRTFRRGVVFGLNFSRFICRVYINLSTFMIIVGSLTSLAFRAKGLKGSFNPCCE